MSFIDKVSVVYICPDKSKFTKKQLKRLDDDGTKRAFLTIKFKKMDDTIYAAIQELTGNQYSIPMKYMKPIPNSYTYIAQKSQISGKEKDIKNAYIVIEPLNADFFNLITYTPINQSLPLGTIITIDVSVPFDGKNGKPPERKFIWSNNLRTEQDISNKIKKENPNSHTLKPWCGCVHYGAVDIGSRLTAKFEVANCDVDIIRSFTMFGFKRSDERQEFTIWTYKCYNITPIDILKLMKQQRKVSETTKKIIDEIITKSPKIEYP